MALNTNRGHARVRLPFAEAIALRAGGSCRFKDPNERKLLVPACHYQVLLTIYCRKSAAKNRNNKNFVGEIILF